MAPRRSAGVVGMWEREEVGRVGVEFYYTGPQRLEENPYSDTSEPYVIMGILAERQFGWARLFVNGENLTGGQSAEPGARRAPDITSNGFMRTWSQEHFVKAARTLTGRGMPWAIVKPLGDTELDAILMYLKVLGISAYNAEQFAKTYNEIGINYAELGNPDESIKAFAAAVKYMPESVEYRNNYAYALWMNGRLDDALREYQAVLKLDPRNWYAISAMQEIRASINN